MADKNFLNDIFTNDDLMINSMNLMYTNPQEVEAYVKSQGYATDGDQFYTEFETESADEIFLWAGVYEFSEPESYKNRLLTIKAKEKTVYLDKTELTITANGDRTFSFAVDTTTVKITFYENIADNGSVLPNTFDGKIETPHGEDPPTFELIKGKQKVYEEPEDSWGVMEWLGISSAIATLLGVPLMIIGYKACFKKDTTSENLVEMRERFDGIKENVQREAVRRLTERAQASMEQDREAIIREVSAHISDRTGEMLEDPNISRLSVDEQITRVNEDLGGEIDRYIKERVEVRYRAPLTGELGEINFFGDMSTVLAIKDSVVDSTITASQQRASEAFTGQDFVSSCIRKGVLDGRVHYLAQHADEVERQRAELADTMRETADEYRQVNESIDALNEQLRNPDLGEAEKTKLEDDLRREVDRQSEVERRREDEERQSREYEEDARETREERERREEEADREGHDIDGKGEHIHFR